MLRHELAVHGLSLNLLDFIVDWLTQWLDARPRLRATGRRLMRSASRARMLLRHGPESLRWHLTREIPPHLPHFHCDVSNALQNAAYGRALFSVYRPEAMVLAGAVFDEPGLSSGETVLSHLALMGVADAAHGVAVPDPKVLRAAEVLLHRLQDRAARDGRPTGLFLENAAGCGHWVLEVLGFKYRGYRDGPSWHLPDRSDPRDWLVRIKHQVKRVAQDR